MTILFNQDQTESIRMKIVILLLAFVAVSLAQQHGNHGNHNVNEIGRLIHAEVQALLKDDPALTVDHCTTKCDALFDLVASNDEDRTDKVCAQACDCEVNKTCHYHNHTDRPHGNHN
jgi:hypothetical protein